MSPKEAKILSDEIFKMISDLKGNANAQSLCASVSENTHGIMANINEWRKVTPRQAEALENMKAALEVWLGLGRQPEPGEW